MKIIQNTKLNFNPNLFFFSLGTHKEKKVIWIQFEYNPELIALLKSYTQPHWSNSQKSWYVIDNNTYRNLFRIELEIVGKAVLDKIAPVNIKELERYRDILKLKAFSPNTLRTYCIEFAQLLYILKDIPVNTLTAERLQSYFLYCVKELQLSENQIHSRMNAIKFYFEKVLHLEKMFFDIPRPKKPSSLPKYLNTDEIKLLFSVTQNLKHLLLLQLCYGMGLRVSEVVTLKIVDIDSKSMKVLVQKAKGKKDRYVNLPNSVLDLMRQYYKEYSPKEFLFEGQYGGQYSVRSAQLVFTQAMKKAGINKKIGIHGLRHSYATHLLEYGTDISLIQKLLGHNDIKTTLVYTQVADKSLAKIISPLDYIDKNE